MTLGGRKSVKERFDYDIALSPGHSAQWGTASLTEAAS